MSTYVYAEHVNSNLVCCICRMPFVEPVSTTTCSHTFCKDCIQHAITISPQCPVDRSPLNKDDLQPANAIVRNLVDELTVECPKRNLGCLHTCQRQHLATHLKDECEYVKLRCGKGECNTSFLRKESGKHAECCEHRIVECYACGSYTRFIDMKDHQDLCPAEEAICAHCNVVLPRAEIWTHEPDCPEKVIKCSHEANGCSWSGPRKDLSSSHLQNCVYESLKGFFAINSVRITTLENENSGLRETIEDLERCLRATKGDLQTTQGVLGPWLRSDGGQAPPRPTPPIEPPPRTYPRRRLSNALNSAMFGNSTETGPSTEPASRTTPLDNTTPTDPLAQYFPPETISSPGEDPMAPLFDAAYPRLAPSSPVAPLNLNTTLEGSLASLRNSIVTLAASLDSESRRHDIALATETLRVNEEVMALRAIVHGLRMQVHQIMMDRNSQVTDDDEGPGFKYSHAPASVRYLNQHPPIHRPINIGTTTHIQTTKL